MVKGTASSTKSGRCVIMTATHGYRGAAKTATGSAPRMNLVNVGVHQTT